MPPLSPLLLPSVWPRLLDWQWFCCCRSGRSPSGTRFALVECFWALRTDYAPQPTSALPPSAPLCLGFACRFSFMMMLLLFVFDQFVFFASVVYFPYFMHFNLLANLSLSPSSAPSPTLSCVNCNVAFMCPRIKISILRTVECTKRKLGEK